MAKSKLDLMYKKEQEEELKKKCGVKQTTPNVKILMGKNEEKMKTLTGDSNFGSTVKNAFVKGATLQAQNQTMLAQNVYTYGSIFEIWKKIKEGLGFALEIDAFADEVFISHSL